MHRCPPLKRHAHRFDYECAPLPCGPEAHFAHVAGAIRLCLIAGMNVKSYVQTDGRAQMLTKVSVPKEVAEHFKLQPSSGVSRFGHDSHSSVVVSLRPPHARHLASAVRDRDVRSTMYQAMHCLPVRHLVICSPATTTPFCCKASQCICEALMLPCACASSVLTANGSNRLAARIKRAYLQVDADKTVCRRRSRSKLSRSFRHDCKLRSPSGTAPMLTIAWHVAALRSRRRQC